MSDNPQRLIVMVGLDGSGKSTQLQLLGQHLKTQGRTVKQLRQPSTLRRYVHTVRGHALYIYLADQAIFLSRLGSYDQNYLLVDRWITCTHVYQPHDPTISHPIHSRYPSPDLMIFLDTPPEVAQRRASSRRYPDVYDAADVEVYIERRQRYLEQLGRATYPVATITTSNKQRTHQEILLCLQHHRLLPHPPA